MNWWFDILLVLATVLIVFIAIKLQRQSMRAAQAQLEIPWSTATNKSIGLYPSKLIRQCGIIPGEFKVAYWASKGLFSLLLPMILSELRIPITCWYVYLAAAFVGCFCIDCGLWWFRGKRKAKIERNLYYFIDLIVAFLHSGLSLPEAFGRAAEHGLPQDNPLAWEVGLVSLELAAGLDRKLGFRNLAERTGVVALDRLAAVLDVGFSSGSSVGEILKGQSELLRVRAWESGEELINRKALQSLLPMALVSIPLLMVLIFFPATIQLLEALSLFRASFF